MHRQSTGGSISARSGRWLATGSKRRTLCGPRRWRSVSIKAAQRSVGRHAPTLTLRRCGGGSEDVSSVCRAGIGSARVTASPIASKPKPASSRRRQRIELEIDEARHMGDAARRQRQPDIDRLDCAIDAVERKPQRARADIVAHQHMHKGLHEAVGTGDDGLLGDDRSMR